MSGGAASYNISIADISKSMEAEGFKKAEVEAVMKTAEDDKVWNAMEGLIGKDVSDDDLVAAIGPGQDANKGLLSILKPKVVNPKDPHVIEIGKFAVKNHNEKAGTELVFIKVFGGIKWNVIGGTFYELIIETRDSRGTHGNKALIVEYVTGHKKLMWYKN